jgi:hypothetical protein
MVSKIKTILNRFFMFIASATIIFGLAIEFMPNLGVEWHQLTHYWYVWMIMLISVVGFYYTRKK